MDNTLFSALNMNVQARHLDEHVATNQRNDIVAICRRHALMHKRPAVETA